MATKRIKDLTATATQMDLISENYGVLDTSGITKKVPGYLLGGGSGTTYSAGNAIDLTNNEVSVKYSKGLEVNASNELEVKVGTGLTFDDNSNIISNIGAGIYVTSDGKLTTVEPDENFIDITNEWVFMNEFRLQYMGSTPGYNNNMRILYSPVSDIVKFTSSCRINRTTPIIYKEWNHMLQYKGNRFYTTYNAPNVNLAPAIGLTGALGGMAFTVGTDHEGSSRSALLKVAYVGTPQMNENDCSLAIQGFIDKDNPSIYGCILQNLIMKVNKKV